MSKNKCLFCKKEFNRVDGATKARKAGYSKGRDFCSRNCYLAFTRVKDLIPEIEKTLRLFKGIMGNLK